MSNETTDGRELYRNTISDEDKTDAMNTLRKAMSRLNEGDRDSTYDIDVTVHENQ